MQHITSPAGTRLAKATAVLDLSFELRERMEIPVEEYARAREEFMAAARAVGAELIEQRFHLMEEN